MNPDDYVGLVYGDTVGCPILKVNKVNGNTFTLLWPGGLETVAQYECDGPWSKLAGAKIRGAIKGCSCYRCTNALFGLALSAE